MDFLIATHNMKKRAELQRILEPLGVRVHLAEELGLSLREPEETGSSFAENAYIKALSGCEDSGLPCVADDSGLVVDALGGRPGVYSARYAGEDTPYPEKIARLLGELDGVPPEKRTARFVSAVCCVFPDGRILRSEGCCEGCIGLAPDGEGGFGYDPVFYVKNKSFARMTSDEKDKISHRGNALRAFATLLANKNSQ